MIHFIQSRRQLRIKVNKEEFIDKVLQISLVRLNGLKVCGNERELVEGILNIAEEIINEEDS